MLKIPCLESLFIEIYPFSDWSKWVKAKLLKSTSAQSHEKQNGSPIDSYNESQQNESAKDLNGKENPEEIELYRW